MIGQVDVKSAPGSGIDESQVGRADGSGPSIGTAGSTRIDVVGQSAGYAGPLHGHMARRDVAGCLPGTGIPGAGRDIKGNGMRSGRVINIDSYRKRSGNAGYGGHGSEPFLVASRFRRTKGLESKYVSSA